MTEAFTVHHYNFGISKSFSSYEEAKAYAIKACFEAVVYTAGNKIATFSPISGWRSAL